MLFRSAAYAFLKQPIERLTLPDTIIPAGPVMEDWVMLSPEKIAAKVKACIA